MHFVHLHARGDSIPHFINPYIYNSLRLTVKTQFPKVGAVWLIKHFLSNSHTVLYDIPRSLEESGSHGVSLKETLWTESFN